MYKVGLTMENKINIEKLMEGLGIEEADIVLVAGNALLCNEKFDLVKVDGTYSPAIPNYILGMVSGKYGYEVYKSMMVVKGDSDGEKKKN